MCGIAGIYAYRQFADPVDRDELARIRDHMTARGPDGKGEWIAEDRRVGFGHRRLSIIDLSDAGAQPMTSADRNLVVTFNGEIYNYRELRKRLEAKGRTFRSHSDTEVLLHLYAEKGDEMVRDLRGMFAFAIWDAGRRRLFLARDPYGIKPLYYCDDGATFRFASQVKALLAGGAVSRDPEPAGWAGFFMLGGVPEPFTTYRDIRALPAGATLSVFIGGVDGPRRYHSIAAAYAEAEQRAQHDPTANDRQEKIRAALLDSVSHHLVADVPVGAFLSAGIDSGALVGLMRDAGQDKIETVTLAFDEFRGEADDEAPLAAEIAQLYGTQHSTRIVTGAEFLADLPKIIETMDQPSIDGVNTWFVSKAAAERGLKVAISGLGGDELFGGYPTFTDVPKWVRWLSIPAKAPGLGYVCRKMTSLLNVERFGLSPKTCGLIELGGSFAGAYLLRRGLFMPWELSRLLGEDLATEGLGRLDVLARINAELEPVPSSDFAKVAVLESTLYMRHQLLRDTDWASMAHSVEVRTPLVDSVLLDRIAGRGIAQSGAAPKADLASAPSQALPARVRARRKTGFAVPIAAWAGIHIDRPTHSAYGHSRTWARHVAVEASRAGRQPAFA